MRTISLLSDLALFGKREEDLLRSCLGDSTLEVGRDVDSTVWLVYLTQQINKNDLVDRELLTRLLYRGPYSPLLGQNGCKGSLDTT